MCKSIAGLIELDLDLKPVVYHLLYEEEIVYVGSTINLYSRISSHLNSDKVFDRCLYYPTDYSNLEEEEAIQILNLKPKYNKSLPNQDRFVSHQKLKQMLMTKNSDIKFKEHIHLTKLKRYVCKLNLKKYIFLGTEYIEVGNLDSLYQMILDIKE